MKGEFTMKGLTLEEYSQKYQTCKFEREDGILQVTMHTKGKDLIWDFVTDEEIGFMLGDIGNDPENKVIIITGTGETFIDNEEFGEGPIPPQVAGDHIYTYAKRLMNNYLNIPQPIISAINGPATIHAEMGLLADIVLSSHDAVFQDAPHFQNGLVPGDGVQVIWPMLLGLNQAKYFLLTGQKLTAQRLHELGVVNEIMPKKDLVPRAWEIARKIMEQPPLTVRLTREVLNRDLKRKMNEDLSFGLMAELIGFVDYFPSQMKKPSGKI